MKYPPPHLVGAFAVGTLAVGLPFWIAPYNTLNVPDGFLGPGLLVVLGLAMVLRATGSAGFLLSLNLLAWTLPAAILARVIIDTQIYPTRHNLWPIVVLIAALLGYAVAATGTVIGHLVRCYVVSAKGV